MTHPVLRRIRAHLRRPYGRLAMAFGRAASLKPLSADFGYSRGTPVDRYYIEDFLEANAQHVRGNVLEVKDDSYSRRFGGERVTRQDVLDIDASNPKATIIGDLAERGVLPAATFDCIIVTQTLQFIFDLRAAVREIRQALRPGGVALITVGGISSIYRSESVSGWYWSLTPLALRKLLEESFDEKQVAVSGYGNLFAATAFLHGAALEEVNERKMDSVDPAYPLIVAARAVA